MMPENLSVLRPVPGGSGPNSPDLETRIAQLESKVDRIDVTTRSIEVSLAEIKGKLSQSPTWIQLLVALLATWGAGAAIIAAMSRILSP
jgi:hypothetical protein